MYYRRIIVLFIATIAVFGCKNKKEIVKDRLDNLYAYREYVTDVSPGMISAYADIRVVLKKPVKGWNKDEKLDDHLISVKPFTKGKVVALNNQTIAFIPDEKLKGDTEYEITLKLDDIVSDIPSDLESFTFYTRTYKQQFNVTTDQLQSYNKDYQYLTGTIRSSDRMNVDEAKKLITATQGDKKLKIKISSLTADGTQIPFKIDSIQRFVDDSTIKITWDGSEDHIESKGEATLTIPGQNNFAIVDVSVIDDENQYLEINFSDPLKKGQNFEGLVSVENANQLKFSAEGNILKVYTGKHLEGNNTLEVFQGIESEDGFKLKNIFNQRIAFEQLKPNVRLLSNATILPSSNNLKINFEAVNLKAVDVTVIKIFENNIMQFLQYEDLNSNADLHRVGRPIAKKAIQLQSNLTKNNGKWRAYALDLSELITPDPGAIYRVEFSFSKKYSNYKCDGEVTNSDVALNNFDDYDEEVAESSYWNAADYYYDYYGDDYNWRERDNPCSNSYYYNKTVKTNVLASDLGLTVKKGANLSYFVSVNDIVNTLPLAGTNVTFYNYQQQPIGSVITKNDGTNTFKSKVPAFFAIASRNKQKTYLKLDDGNVLSMSKFDVAGVALQKGIKGYMYGERGVWRPGDSIYLSFILDDNINKLPANHPVKFELSDPYGKVVQQEVQNYGNHNFYTFLTKTDANAPTGNWLAKVKVGGVTFTKNLRIETVKPNRLKIKANFDGEELSSSKPVKGHLEVAWLHGAIARNLKADINAKFNQESTTFKAFPGFVFDDPTRRFQTEEQVVFNGKVDNEGKADFSLKPQLKAKAPGKLKASFVTKVYENGGDFSTDVFSKTYSPYDTYVGLNVPKGDKARGMLLTDTKHTFEVATVDENGNPKAVEGVKVAIYKIEWRWWWDTSQDNMASFNADNYKEKVYSTTINTNSKGRADFQFELKYPDWGRYLVRVEDPKGGHATGKAIYIDWPGWAGKSRKNDPSAATMLVFSTDKKAYTVGDKAIITFPSSSEGRALVTVENGSEVIDARWIEAQKGETKFELPITEQYAPNVYIHISLLQPHANSLNDLPIRLYGVVPISVENPKTHLHPEIVMDKVLRPESTTTIKVSEKEGKAMTYSLAIVDEGLLDLTRFKTPNPWDVFYAREALGVQTWDVYDEVIGAFGGKIDQVFSIGGDQDLAGAKNKKANRFDPMVKYLGPFTLEAGKTDKHTIKIPKYVGSVRTMVVAENVDDEAYGSTEETTPVRKPLMVLASLPRKVTPGEQVTLPVTVFAMESKVKDVKVRLKTNDAFTVDGNDTQSLGFTQPDEKMAYFTLKVNDVQQIGKLTVEVSGNGEKASYDVEVDVINPNPVTTEVKAITLEPNSTKEIAVNTFGVSGSNEAKVEFSTLPPMDFNNRLSYLITYPHGCIEQTTSAAFPQLYLSDVVDIDYKRKQEIEAHIKNAINRLANFQLPGGGFSYWPGMNRPDDWGSSYAGHFLIEAEKKGYVLPIGFKAAWINYQQNAAKGWRMGAYDNGLSQAYRLYTLALAKHPDVASMNRLRETSGISNEAKHRLAAAYALVGQKSIASQIFNSANIDFKPKKYDYYTYGSVNRNRAMALETLTALGDKTKANELAKAVAAALNDNQWMSTQTTAYSLLAMAKYAQLIGGKGMNVAYSLRGSHEKVNTTKTLASRPLDIKKGNNTVTLTNTADNTVFVNVTTSGILPVGEEKVLHQNLSAQISYKGRDGKAMSVSELMQGTDFVAEVTITNSSGNDLKNMALTEIFPSGWEIVNTRFTDFGDFAENPATYTDLRDDSANFYFDIEAHKSKSFRILLNASYLGTYYLPGIQAEAMYDHDYIVRTQGSWVKVVQ
ncbi:alpha-2-macroglobulin family protein [Zhouia sp. PK063]|uniref:alpha-2-macroglobulin family protein n=1 Tax=Zhouia sp. PK063 TaxID=3373602 RepID=UPI00378F7335